MTLGHTKIPYLDRLWHPTTGCSLGCPTCWARPLVVNRLAGTMKGLPHACVSSGYPDYEAEDGDPFAPTFHADRLCDPLRARKPQVIGVSFLGDLFDPAIRDEQIAAVFGVMAAAHWHTFVVLTKQAERMERWFRWVDSGIYRPIGVECQKHGIGVTESMRQAICIPSGRWPLPNVWMGVSATNQRDAERIAYLLRASAAHRWVSAEPLVGPVDLPLDGIDLVIAGGESGSKARPCHPDWARSLRDQCAAAGVPFNWKQWGEWAPARAPYNDHITPAGRLSRWVNPFEDDQRKSVRYFAHGADGRAREVLSLAGTKAAGRLLDGQMHDDLPWRIER